MKPILKNVLGVALVAAISAGAAVGTTSYLMNKNQGGGNSSAEYENIFKQQPVRLVNYNGTAAENTDFTVAAESAVHAVVHIKATTNVSASSGERYIDPFEYFFGFGGRGGFQRPEAQPRVGSGSGVIISTDGYIITNNHVIEGADDLEVTLNDNRKYTAKVIGADPTTDIALIKIEEKDLPTIPFGDSEKLKVGEWVLAIGNPFNLTSTVTAGIVSAKSRGNIGTNRGDRSKIESFIQTDAAVNPGNSGGALVNTKGELVGINTAIYSETGNFAGYSFAVPVSIAGKVVSDLKQYGVVQRAMLGVMMISVGDIMDVLSMPNLPEESRKEYQAMKDNIKVSEGAYVSEFADKSSAKAAGIEIGDVIIAVNGTPIGEMTGFPTGSGVTNDVTLDVKAGDNCARMWILVTADKAYISGISEEIRASEVMSQYYTKEIEGNSATGLTFMVRANAYLFMMWQDTEGKYYYYTEQDLSELFAPSEEEPETPAGETN